MWTILSPEDPKHSFPLEIFFFPEWVPSTVDSSFRLPGNSGTLVTLVRPHLLLLAAIISIFAAEYLGRTWCFLFYALNHKFSPNKFWGRAGTSTSLYFWFHWEKLFWSCVLGSVCIMSLCKAECHRKCPLPGVCNQAIPTNTVRIWAIKIISGKKSKLLNIWRTQYSFRWATFQADG